MKNKTLAAIKDHGVVAILRRVPADALTRTVQALYDGGVRLVEITYDQNNPEHLTETPRAIELLCKTFGERMWVGAGTVLTEEQTLRAARAGAGFILSPNTDRTVIETTVSAGLVSVPGAFTPTEIVQAYALGGDIIKIFPAGELGLPYLQALRGPLNHIPFMAVGGITPENIGDLIRADITGFGIGSALVKNEWIRENRYEKIMMRAKLFTDGFLKGGKP